MMIATVPPSALHAAPVTYEACGEQRNAITDATSAASANLPSGLPDPTSANTSSRVLPVRAARWSASPPSSSHAGVAVGPGATAFDLIPSFPYTSVIRRDSESTADFVNE